MKLSIVIVSWNIKKDLAVCLDSIRKSPPSGKFEIILIDNASSDGTVDFVEKNFPEVMVIANDSNRGFAAANNQGIRASQGQYILLLNPDTIIHENSLDILIQYMDENKDVGACGPKLLNEDRTIQPSARSFPTFRGALYRHTALRYFSIFKSAYKKWMMKDFDYKSEMDVDQLMGAALLIRKTVIDSVGAMDENFFMYYEEVDFCYRIKQAGWHIAFVPDAQIIHLGGQSTGQIPVKKQIMAITSLIKFFRKHRGRGTTAIFNCIFKPAILLRNLCDIVTGIFLYITSLIAGNQKRRNKTVIKLRKSLQLLSKYGWKLIDT